MATGYDIHPYPSDPIERFHTRYKIDAATGCWIWQPIRPGYDKSWQKHRFYPQMRVAPYVTMRASHFVLQIVGRPVEEGQLVCHSCDNPLCVNPDHLFVGNQRDNIQDAIKKGRFVQNLANNRQNAFDRTGKPHKPETIEKLRKLAMEREAHRRETGFKQNPGRRVKNAKRDKESL